MEAQLPETRMKGRSSRLAQLIRIYEAGQVSELMDRTVDKLLSVEETEARQDIEDLTAALLAYEERFGMASEAFYQRFEAGELGDRADFIEWASFYDMLQNAKKRLQAVSDEG